MISKPYLFLTISSILFLTTPLSLVSAQTTNSTEVGISINLDDIIIIEDPPTYLPSDLNQNGIVDIYDYNIFVSSYGYQESPVAGPADLNQDGVVNIYDYNILVEEFGMSYTPEPVVFEAPNNFRSPPPETTDPIDLPSDAIIR